jgi:O-antigen ligase
MLQFINKKNYFKVLLISWIFFWLSIGVTPLNLDYNLQSYINVINIFRVYIPLFFIIFFLILIIFIKLLKVEIDIKKDYFSFINFFLIYFLIQLIGLYQNKFASFNLENLYLIILGFGVLEIFIINQFFNNKNLKYLLHASIIICLLSSTLTFLLLNIKNDYYSFLDVINLNLRTINDVNLDKQFFLNTTYPRSTGISRTFGLINIFIIIYFLFYIKKRISKYLFYFISFIYTSLIWLMQSRGTLLIFFTTISFIIFSLKKEIKNKLFFIFILFFLPIIFSEGIIFTARNFYYNNTNSHTDTHDNIQQKNRVIKDTSSSGRITIWEESLKNYDRNKLFGYGPQGDRFLLTNSVKASQYSNNASNALVYSFLSGGYFAIVMLLLIYLSILRKIYICHKKFKIFENGDSANIKIAVSYALYLFLRSFFENSFSLFSIDFLIFICSAIYIENYLKQRQRIF